MDIPIGVEVSCSDGKCGRSVLVIINPVMETVTHVVVGEMGPGSTKHVVPIDRIVETTPNRIVLSLDKATLRTLEPLVETEWVKRDVPYREYGVDQYLMSPYALPEGQRIPITHKRIPLGELAVRRGMQVIANDGPVGSVDEFLVDPGSGHITHLVLREGHLWVHRDVSIPVSDIAKIEQGSVHLRLTRDEVAKLPILRVRHV